MYNHILFDFDGTLCNSVDSIVESYKYALSHHTERVFTDTEIHPLIGMGLEHGIMEILDTDKETAIKLADVYKEHNSINRLEKCTLFAGVKELLESLKRSNKKIYIATMMDVPLTEVMVKHFEIEKHFTFLGGSHFATGRNTKQKVIEHVIEQNDIELDTTIMIGDTPHDISGAHQNKIQSIGVSFGYGNNTEIQNEKPNYFCNTIEELSSILL